MSTNVWDGREAGVNSLERGTYSWPISMTLPRDFESHSDKAKGKRFLLPPTFTAIGYPEFLLYEIVVTVVRKGIFRNNDILSIPFRYIYRPMAAAIPLTRVLSYEARSPIPGPDVDPESWNQQEVKLRGHLFSKPVRVDCEFSLALPMEYPRGYPIPFAIRLRSSDLDALDLLSSYTGLSVCLMRQFAVINHASQDRDTKYFPHNVVARGRYWLSHQSNELRSLEGEIQVPGHLSPSFTYPRLVLSYFILLSSEAGGLRLENEPPLVSIPVTVTYFPAPGLTPRSYAPPLRPGEDSPAAGVWNVPYV